MRMGDINYVGGIRCKGKLLKDIRFTGIYNSYWLEGGFVDGGNGYWCYTWQDAEVLHFEDVEIREVGSSKWEYLNEVVDKYKSGLGGDYYGGHIVEADPAMVMGFKSLGVFVLEDASSDSCVECRLDIIKPPLVVWYASKESFVESTFYSLYRGLGETTIKDMRQLGREVLDVLDRFSGVWLVKGVSAADIKMGDNVIYEKRLGVSVLREDSCFLPSFDGLILEHYLNVVGK